MKLPEYDSLLSVSPNFCQSCCMLVKLASKLLTVLHKYYRRSICAVIPPDLLRVSKKLEIQVCNKID